MKTCLYSVKIRLHRNYVHANIGLSMFLQHALSGEKSVEKLAFQRVYEISRYLEKDALRSQRSNAFLKKRI